MDEEATKLLREELEVNKENNKLLTKLVWYQKWARWFGAIKWIIIVGSTIGALYYLQPFLDGALNYYKTLLDTVSDTSVQTLPNR